jgi:hypothetical protein
MQNLRSGHVVRRIGCKLDARTRHLVAHHAAVGDEPEEIGLVFKRTAQENPGRRWGQRPGADCGKFRDGASPQTLRLYS